MIVFEARSPNEKHCAVIDQDRRWADHWCSRPGNEEFSVVEREATRADIDLIASQPRDDRFFTV